MKHQPFSSPNRFIVAFLAFVFSLSCLAHAQEVKRPAGDIFTVMAAKKRKTQTINNAKQIFYLLVDFDQEYGAYPSDATAKEDPKFAGFTGKYSNDYFGQFFAGGFTKSEQIFYAAGGSKTKKKPDNLIANKKQILSAGECGFTYIKGLSTASDTRLPLLCAPMTGKGTQFDPKPYNGVAIVLFCDGSVQALEIDKNGEARRRDGTKLFSNGVRSPWAKIKFKQDRLAFPK
ncbi:MAG: hypothetical protein ACPG32_07555 [Akkermansiaceae bacterium]